ILFTDLWRRKAYLISVSLKNPIRQEGAVFDSFSRARQGGCKGFVILAPLLFEGRPPSPFEPFEPARF
ncbi:hypothetical protein, partial [uncultured Dialister sp.]|uniref:hypothetical protein n=1 Tax=uncultured Dialister sp. TaxID=278064 RepID=UPI0025CD77E2